MKLPVIAIFAFLSSVGFGQKGFHLIRKAEKKIEQGKYKRASNLLDQAATMSYGFCGNAWIEAEEAIRLNRIKIHQFQGNYLAAANELNNNCDELLFYRRDYQLDSLKMANFLMSIDKTVIKREIDSCLALITTMDSVNFWEGLKLGVHFSEKRFCINSSTLMAIRNNMVEHAEKNTDFSILDRFKMALREQPFYLLLE